MRKVLITGSTAGFGKLLVETFLENGDLVIATGRKLTARQDIFQATRPHKQGKLFEFDMDVTDLNEISLLVKQVEQQFGSIDILINNAGYGAFGALEDLSEKDIRFQMEVNFFGTVNVTRLFMPLLRKSQGKIFNFSSVFGFMGFPLTSLYCASKYAVEGLTESLRGEIAPFGVQVCLIEPGGYTTDFRKNIVWNVSDNSLYANQIENYKELHEVSAQRKPQDPKEVSQGLLTLSKKRQLPMRKVFGTDGKLSYCLKNYLPEGLYFNIMDGFFKSYFNKKRKA